MDRGAGRQSSCHGFCSAEEEEANKRGKWRKRAGRWPEMSERGKTMWRRDGRCDKERRGGGRQEGQRRC